jgi:hypothetical protein
LLKIILACNGNDEGSDNLSKMYDCDELDDLEPGPAPHMFNNLDESFMFCEEFGRDERVWFRCGLRSGWVHAECSAAETSKNLVYDF